MSEESAQSPCLGDWDGDGDADMALGFISGPVKLYLNNGDLTFTEAGAFTSNGKSIEASDGGPCIVDWDGDHKLDLLLGDGEGDVVFYQGAGNGSRKLSKRATLLRTAPENARWTARRRDPNSRYGFTPGAPGVRAKPFAADWNGDGKLDLLVGDYMSMEKPVRQLSEAERAELSRLENKQRDMMSKITVSSRKILEAAYKKVGKKQGERMTPEESRKFSKAYGEAIQKDKEYQAAQKEWSKLYTRLAQLKPGADSIGFVWVYLRK